MIDLLREGPVAIRRAREIVWLLSVVWLEADQRYVKGWSDGAVALHGLGDIGAVREVEALRRAAFGAGEVATPAFRGAAAIMLTDQHFDATAEQGARDAVVEAHGQAALLDLQDRGGAPAGGAWEADWSDDRVAELAGVAPESVREIRESLRWIPPEARPEARRQRRVLLLPPERDPLTRVVRMLTLIDPLTGAPYTAEGLLDVVIHTRQLAPPKTPAARRRELATVALAMRVGWLLLDDWGRLRNPATIATMAPGKYERVLGIVARLGPEVAGREGRPSRLTPEVVARVEAADPRRFDRRSIFAWLRSWIWSGEGPASLRTIKGWSAAGKADAEAGRDTLAARFAAAVARLVDKAPAEPILPSRAELVRYHHATPQHAAAALACTVEQIEKARREHAKV